MVLKGLLNSLTGMISKPLHFLSTLDFYPLAGYDEFPVFALEEQGRGRNLRSTRKPATYHLVWTGESAD